MKQEPTATGYLGEHWLSLERLRELAVPDGRTFPPYRVAKEILYHEPLAQPHERNETHAILSRLIEEAEQKMEKEGVEPTGMIGTTPKLPKRLREEALWVGALYTYTLPNGNLLKETKRFTERGGGWLHLAGDHLQQALYWFEIGKISSGTSQPLTALNAYRKATDHAEQAGDRELLLKIIYLYAIVLLREQERDQAEVIIKRGMQVLEDKVPEKQYRLHRSKLLNLNGRVLFDQREYRKAVSALLAALDVAVESDDPASYCSTHGLLADIYQTLGDYSTALHHWRQVAEAAERNNRTVICGIAWSKTGKIHTELQDYEQARDAFRLAYSFIPEDHLMSRQNIMASEIELAMKTGATEEGISLCNRLLDTLSPDEKGPHRTTALIQLGKLHEQQKQYTKAQKYLEEALHVQQTLQPNTGEIRQIKSDLARILIRKGKTDEARTLLEEITDIQTTTSGEERLKAEGLEMLSEVERLEDNLEKALEYLQEAKSLALDIAERKNTTSIQNARILAEIQMAQQREKQQEGQRKRTERELAQILTTLNGAPLQIDRTEQRLNRTLAWLDPELLERVVNSLKEAVSNSTPDTSIRTHHTLAKLHGVKPEFFVALEERFPDLTAKQQRLCGLIYSGLKTAGIAEVLTITEHGVWMQRKRLRKKMGLGKGVNLEEYLHEFADREQ